MNPEIFEQDQINSLRQQKVRDMVLSAVNVSDLEARNWYLFQNTKTAVDYLLFNPGDYSDILPSEEEINNYYTENKVMPTYDEIYATACARKGGEKNLESLLPRAASKRTLKNLPSDRYLSAFCKKIFQSGFVWRVVEAKWDNFEEVFWDFEVSKLIMMPDDMLERKASDKAIIRNYRKILAIRENAMMIAETQRAEGKGFGEFIASWPQDDITGLWLYLKKHGSRLGGNTGPYALRNLGVDTFLLTRDVEGFLRLPPDFDAATFANCGYTNVVLSQNGYVNSHGGTETKLISRSES